MMKEFQKSCDHGDEKQLMTGSNIDFIFFVAFV